MQFFVHVNIRDWRSRAFVDEEHEKETVAAAIAARNGRKYNDEVINTFLKEYYGARSIQVPKGYSFKVKVKDKATGKIKIKDAPPKLMQLYVAYKVRTEHRFANLSGTGAGKTLSAI